MNIDNFTYKEKVGLKNANQVEFFLIEGRCLKAVSDMVPLCWVMVAEN